jgi:DNA-binding SARP family transcriptional activator
VALRVKLLGGLRISPGEGGEAVILPTRKARALLAYLACPPGRAHSRDKLAALLWGDRRGSQARASLRQELYGLRRALALVEPKALSLIDDAVTLEPASVEVDVLHFQRLVTEGTPSALEAAVALYHGELLEGLAPDAPAFEEWLLDEREHLRELAIEALAKLLAHLRSTGALEAALQTGLRLLTFEPAHESVHGALIRLHLRLGRRSAALRQYQLCVDTLQRELGVEPGAETKQLYQEILRAASVAGRVQGDAPGERSPSRSAAAAASDEGFVERPPIRRELARPPFSGRRGELFRLEQRFEAARSESGNLAFLVGEPGIGKTRVLEEFAAQADAAGAKVLWGRCFEGELSRPFGPFAEALVSYAKESDAEMLREELGAFGGVVAKIAPELRERLPDLPEPVVLAPEEERYRLLDAIAQVLCEAARRVPLVLVLDDLQWADGASLALLRYLARFLRCHPVLVLGAYRDVEVGGGHPLGDALVALYREAEVERIALKGLDREAVTELLEALVKRAVPVSFVEAITAETDGNPFFLREVLLHLFEEGKLERAAARFPSRFSIEEIGIPEGVRQVIGRRLSRLPAEANQLLATASGCAGAFRFDVTAAAADLEEHKALDALDAALEAQILCATGDPEVYDFTHALIRHTLYGELNPSRQVRVHRRLAEEMEACYRVDAPEHAFEIAQQWHRSAAMPGAERGVVRCLAAADRSEQAAAHEEAAVALQMALDLLPAGDAGRPRLLARLGLALSWSLENDEAVRVASEAGELLAASEGNDAAADYLADVAGAVWASSFDTRAWALARQGLRYAGSRRDLTWARLASLDLDGRDASDPDFPGIRLDRPERHEVSRILLANASSWVESGAAFTTSGMVFESRADAIERAGSIPQMMAYIAGEYAPALALASQLAAQFAGRGQLGPAVLHLTVVARCLSALGNLAASREAFARATELAARIGNPPFIRFFLEGVPADYMGVQGEGYGLFLPLIEGLLAQAEVPENRWVGAAVRAGAALAYAYAGRGEDALRTLERVFPAIERAAGWAWAYTVLVYWVIEALWVLERCDHADVLEHNLRQKTLASDFRYPHTDARLALARLYALTGRFEEAREWFEKARHVLDEQGAWPLRAITDFDEAWMEVRRGGAGDRERALALLDAARGAFESIGMPGWLRRADELRQQLEP